MPQLFVNTTHGISVNEIFEAVKDEGNVIAEITGESFCISGDSIHLVRIHNRLTGKRTQYMSFPAVLLRRSE